MGKMDEQIIVVSREKLFDNESLVFEGTLIDETKFAQIMHNISNNYEVVRRGDAEVNPDYKQPIPYTIVRKGNLIFTYKRLIGGGEQRLHNMLSIGVGGHMNDLDSETEEAIGYKDFNLVLTDNIQRELHEELYISEGEREISVVGLINDDSNDVGKVHIGILTIIDIDEKTIVEINEKEQLEGEWIPLEGLRKPDLYNSLENWSKIAVDSLVGV